MIAHPLPWCDPLKALASLSQEEEDFAFLHSSQPDPAGSQQSLLALHPQEKLMTASWEELQEAIASNPQALWLGHMEYEMGEGGLACFTRYGNYYLFDSMAKKIELFCHCEQTTSTKQSILPNTHKSLDCEAFTRNDVQNLTSNMTKLEYLAHIRATLEQIHAGEFYQANITRKFRGEFSEKPEIYQIFSSLCQISPAGYAALMKQGEHTIISSSPESFLSLSKEGRAVTRPIKGTARRSGDLEKDVAIKSALANSSKNQSENLMIVDLMRNDLAKNAISGSVRVEKLFEITEYPHLYHMVSTITAERDPDISPIEIIRGCLPAGSMTGAPKKRVMEWCEAIEKDQRGIYSGALGWIAGDGSADLSVVIRTLILKNNHFEFQVGGGIVADSDPYAEWEETLTKASALCGALGITPEEIRKL